MGSKRNLSLLSLLMICTLGITTACNGVNDGNTEKKASFATQVQEEDFASFEIPASWEKKSELSSNENLVYGPKGVPETDNYSRVNIVIHVTGKKVSDIETVRSQFEENYEKTIKEQIPNATGFKIISYKADIGDVLVLSYKVDQTTTTQYCPLVDNAIITIAATDFGEQDALNIEAVAKHIVDTFQLKGNESNE